MSFRASDYENFIADKSPTQARFFPQYEGDRDDFDIIIVGSGVGGGLLADQLADDLQNHPKRILVLEAGSYLFPTHVYNVCRFPNASVAGQFECVTYKQQGQFNDPFYIHEYPQLNFGGRSIFWSGLIPSIQDWELQFFPDQVRSDLAGGLLSQAGELLNESSSMGVTARKVVERLRSTTLNDDFVIQETPRALHQPYLEKDGTPKSQFFTEPTGVFNTAELLINQLGLKPGTYSDDHRGLFLLLNSFVEDVKDGHTKRFQLVVRNTLTNAIRFFEADTVVLAAGSIESPKLLRRSSLFPGLSSSVQGRVGRGLTDHPTTDSLMTYATNIGNVALTPDSHAKIIFYSRGKRDAQGVTIFPFNVEMNINHEYWHLRENDPTSQPPVTDPGNGFPVDIKFSFASCLDDQNEIKQAPPFQYVPEIVFRNQKYTDYLTDVRFPALAGWHKTADEVFAVLNDVAFRIFSEFRISGTPCRPEKDPGTGMERWLNSHGLGFGAGTVHHAAGSLRMPHRPSRDSQFDPNSVIDQDLQVRGVPGLYVCDMSVMPLSTAANPVRTLSALAIRLASHLSA